MFGSVTVGNCFFFSTEGTDSYLYADQMVNKKFRLFHLILEICMFSNVF